MRAKMRKCKLCDDNIANCYAKLLNGCVIRDFNKLTIRNGRVLVDERTRHNEPVIRCCSPDKILEECKQVIVCYGEHGTQILGDCFDLYADRKWKQIKWIGQKKRSVRKRKRK